jgi:hypothetical protein
MSNFVEFQPFLCMRCTPTQKRQLLYLACVLDCDTPILEALAWTTMLNIAVKEENLERKFLKQVRFCFLFTFIEQFGPVRIRAGDYCWERDKGTVYVGIHEKQLEIRHGARGTLLTRYSHLCIYNGFLVLMESWRCGPDHLSLGEFDDFIRDIKQTIIKLYL